MDLQLDAIATAPRGSVGEPRNDSASRRRVPPIASPVLSEAEGLSAGSALQARRRHVIASCPEPCDFAQGRPGEECRLLGRPPHPGVIARRPEPWAKGA